MPHPKATNACHLRIMSRASLRCTCGCIITASLLHRHCIGHTLAVPTRSHRKQCFNRPWREPSRAIDHGSRHGLLKYSFQ
eukprot:1194676-Prorocentrum_minimum.AAC.9